MAMSYFLFLTVNISFAFGLANGRLDEVSAALFSGADSAIRLALSLAGSLCLWNGFLEVLRRSGLDRSIARLFRPLLRRLMPDAARDPETASCIAANLSANLLGLGNAATPMGIQAAKRMARDSGETASNELCLLVVLNTASIQLLPTTVAALRAARGCETSFDLLPAVWFTSLLSVGAGVAAARLFSCKGGRS